MTTERRAVRPPSWWCAAIGITLLAIAVLGSFFTRQYDTQLTDGATYSARDAFGREWKFASQGVSRLERDSNYVIALALLPTVNGERQPMLTSEQREPMTSDTLGPSVIKTVPAVRRMFAQELRLTFSAAAPGVAMVHLAFAPFAEWGWAGALLIAVGGLFAAVARIGQPSVPEALSPELEAAAEQAISRWRGRSTKCPRCLAEPEPGATFCSSCGLRLAS